MIIFFSSLFPFLSSAALNNNVKDDERRSEISSISKEIPPNASFILCLCVVEIFCFAFPFFCVLNLYRLPYIKCSHGKKVGAFFQRCVWKILRICEQMLFYFCLKNLSFSYSPEEFRRKILVWLTIFHSKFAGIQMLDSLFLCVGFFFLIQSFIQFRCIKGISTRKTFVKRTLFEWHSKSVWRW